MNCAGSIPTTDTLRIALLIAGAFAERVRFRGFCIFIALWSVR